jgi:hypothetical protein
MNGGNLLRDSLQKLDGIQQLTVNVLNRVNYLSIKILTKFNEYLLQKLKVLYPN